MASGQRIKGQEAELRVVLDGAQQTSLTDIRNFEVEFQMEILRDGYIGEKSERRDDVYKGIRGKMEIHFETKDVFDFIHAVVQRAKRERGSRGTRINVSAQLNFPNGETKAIYIPNVFFGPFPMNAGGRAEYININLDFEAEDYTLGA